MPKSRSSLLYGFTLFVSAFLLFWVEPLLGKLLLPVFGGTPATWNVCLIFFQAVLLGGYLYAHALSEHVPFRLGAAVHVVLLVAVAFFLPLSLHEALGGFTQGTGAPAPQILRILLLTIGLPFLFLAATSSLLQSWFGASSHAKARDPYFLYAASNLGSLLALLVYPWLIEPFFSINTQWLLWRRGYLLLALLIAVCAVWRDHSADPEEPAAAPVPGSAGRRGQALGWVLWSFVPSSLLLGVTSYLSTDIIAVPLLWTIPLMIYLGAFAFVFARPRFAERTSNVFLIRALCLGSMLSVLGMVLGFSQPPFFFLPLHLLVFAAACLVCLGRVARERPASGDLTLFYLCIAFGGVLGGVFNGLLAPLLFTGISEYPLLMAVACVCRPWERVGKKDLLIPALGLLAILGPGYLAHRAGLESGLWGRLLALGPAALLCYSTVRRPLAYGLGLGVLYFVGSMVVTGQGQELLYRERTFYGTLKVLRNDQDKLIYLVHGSTSHGAQSTDPARRREPLTYYSRSGPAGDLFEELHRTKTAARIGVIGLGTGTLAAYARPDERWTFFELDPGVVKVARNPAYFTYLSDSAAASTLSVVEGDARLMIRDVPDGTFSLLVVDAFSSDSVPAHLLTREAQQLYQRKLGPGGLLAFHVSNRFLRLAQVVGAVAAELGEVARVKSDVRGFAANPERLGQLASVWVVVARTERDLGGLTREARWMPIGTDPRYAWTDDFYDLIGLIKW